MQFCSTICNIQKHKHKTCVLSLRNTFELEMCKGKKIIQLILTGIIFHAHCVIELNARLHLENHMGHGPEKKADIMSA